MAGVSVASSGDILCPGHLVLINPGQCRSDNTDNTPDHCQLIRPTPLLRRKKHFINLTTFFQSKALKHFIADCCAVVNYYNSLIKASVAPW